MKLNQMLKVVHYFCANQNNQKQSINFTFYAMSGTYSHLPILSCGWLYSPKFAKQYVFLVSLSVNEDNIAEYAYFEF